ncbi:hypothetical protein G7Y89_g1441 [Cudoniella acicularis]|uniref:Uncharacterized protein n=1 Tax=Cudoniella acicularis TaxID=354080 RepID=A0A8H4RWB5_9HELO|nr:hypothetical protein G7Y89_g1441 [Cudoniella acicularis]
MSSLTSTHPSPKEQILLDHKLDITPLRSPLFQWPKKSPRTPKQYLIPHERPFGRRAAEWQKEFFGLEHLRYRTEPSIKPIRPGAPTLIAIFYPDQDKIQRRPLEIYMDRIERLANMKEQTILYVPPSLSQRIRNLRHDQHWHIIDDFETIWDIPNNRHQKQNFTNIQPQLYNEFEGYHRYTGWTPNPNYNHAHRSAAYNAKAFVTYDAIMRNPFGSDRWMYVDAGILDQVGPFDGNGKLWGDIIGSQLAEDKFDRSITISGDSGIVIGEYMQSPAYGLKDINHECWADPKKIWMCHRNAYTGSSLGMLNYSIRYMQTVDDMDANRRYSAREEFVIPWVAIRYPNTVFSIPWFPVPKPIWCKWQYPIKACYTTYGGPESVSAVVDPISTIFCRGYKPRKPNLEGGGIYKETWSSNLYEIFRKYYYSMALRWLTKELRNRLGSNFVIEYLLSL